MLIAKLEARRQWDSIFKIFKEKPGAVVHICNSSYTGGRGLQFKASLRRVLKTLSRKYPKHTHTHTHTHTHRRRRKKEEEEEGRKKGGLVEFKLQNHQKKKKKRKKDIQGKKM
jgi:hypothetical protein